MISYRVTGHSLTLSEETHKLGWAQWSREVFADAQVLADVSGHPIHIISPTGIKLHIVVPRVER
jgi:hypothetical protein